MGIFILFEIIFDFKIFYSVDIGSGWGIPEEGIHLGFTGMSIVDGSPEINLISKLLILGSETRLIKLK